MRLVWVVVVAAFGLLPLVAEAAPAPEAKVHFDAGKDYYMQGRYEDAVREFERAYELAPLADLLINIARAETRLNHEERAITFLEKYLAAAPDAIDAPSVRGEVAARRKALEDSRAAKDAIAAAEKSKLEADASNARARASAEDARRARAAPAPPPKWPGPVLLGGGGLVFLCGIFAGLAAAGEARTVSNGGTKEATNFGQPVDFTYMGKFSTAEANGKRDQQTAIALYVIGAAVIVAGVGVTVWAAKGAKKGEPKKASLTLSPTAMGLIAHGAF